jgi:predicted ATPase with chaperone activity
MNSMTMLPATTSDERARVDGLRSVLDLTPEPHSVAQTGLASHVLVDLAAKTMYYRGRATDSDLSDWLGLSRAVVAEVADGMRREGLLETLSQAGPLQYRYALTSAGHQRAVEAFQRDGYVGPAPVPYEDYLEIQSRQSVKALEITPETVRHALAHLVQPPPLVSDVAAGVLSAGALLLYGASGNGKSTIAEAIRQMLLAPMVVPYAIDIGGRTMRLFDARVHEAHPDADLVSFDRRFAIVQRPLVTLGTELALSDLEMGYVESDRTYVAPPQVKANGGVLVIDDLGRQLVRPVELLNRWMAPMASGMDQLSVRGGELLRFPFDVVLVFATNLEPRDLGDEAFLRRIRHKVAVPDPTHEEFVEIFHREADRLGIPFNEQPVERILAFYYDGQSRPMRGSHPGDLLQNVIDFAKVEGGHPELSVESLSRACDAYFVHA